MYKKIGNRHILMYNCIAQLLSRVWNTTPFFLIVDICSHRSTPFPRAKILTAPFVRIFWKAAFATRLTLIGLVLHEITSFGWEVHFISTLMSPLALIEIVAHCWLQHWWQGADNTRGRHGKIIITNERWYQRKTGLIARGCNGFSPAATTKIWIMLTKKTFPTDGEEGKRIKAKFPVDDANDFCSYSMRYAVQWESNSPFALLWSEQISASGNAIKLLTSFFECAAQNFAFDLANVCSSYQQFGIDWAQRSKPFQFTTRGCVFLACYQLGSCNRKSQRWFIAHTHTVCSTFEAKREQKNRAHCFAASATNAHTKHARLHIALFVSLFTCGANNWN